MTSRAVAPVALALLACGRVGFDPVLVRTPAPDVDAGPTDAGPTGAEPTDAPAPDASVDANAPGDSGSVLPTAGLVGAWSFDEADTPFVDRSGRGNDGRGTPGVTWASGCVRGRCFQSSDQSATPIEIPHHASLDLRTFTIFAWVQTRGSGWVQTILSRQYGNEVAQAYRLAIFGPEIQVACRDGRGEVRFRPDTLAANWLHVAGSYDGVTLRLFLNGALVASAPRACAFTQDTRPVYIGASREENNLWSSFNGLIDEVRLYDRALDVEEIAALATP